MIDAIVPASEGIRGVRPAASLKCAGPRERREVGTGDGIRGVRPAASLKS